MFKFIKFSKKIFIFIFLISIFFVQSNAIEMTLDQALKNFSWDLNTDFYKRIDEWVQVVEEKFYEKEFRLNKKDWNISEILNKIAKDKWLTPCFSKEITFKKITLFVRSATFNAWYFKDFLDEKCYEVMDLDILEAYKNVILEAYSQMHKKAEEKVKRIDQIIKTWIYSDWTRKNSSFDLISDLDDINDILFRNKIKYYWTFKEDLGDADIMIKELLKWKSPKEALKLAKKWENNIWDVKITDPISNLRPTPITDWNTSVCPPTWDNSWLNKESFEKLKDSLDWQQSSNNSNQQNNNENLDWLGWTPQKLPTWYKRKTDDNVWPCFKEDKNNNEFNFHSSFCIKLETRKYTYNLLDYWEVRTIQWLLERSNEHLKKFTHVSLVPNKMTVNNFEIWTVDLNLPDLFHTNIIVRWEPVPILDLKKANPNKKDDDFSLNNLLKKHFEKNHLIYKRENDLQIFLWRDYELQNVNMSKDDNLLKITKNINKWNKMKVEKEKYEDKIFDRQFYMKSNTQELAQFYSLFTELLSFTKRFKDYSQDLNNIIKQMNKKPSI